MTNPVQQELVLEDEQTTELDLHAFLNKSFGLIKPRPVDLRVTQNRVSMVSVDPRGRGPVKVRLHEAFLKAPESVFRDLRRFIRTGRRSAWLNVARYARGIETEASRKDASPKLATKGRVFDLERILKDVNKQYFHGRMSCSIGWARKRASRRRMRSIRFGSWNRNTRTIRIHPLLDDERVPEAFVIYIVFHEMLHGVVPEVRRGGRRYDHSKEFRALEKSFPGLAAMKDMAKQIFAMLQKDAILEK